MHERWPDYRAGLFEACGYQVLDGLRERFWLNEWVAWWYAQNMLLYVRGDVLLRQPPLRRELAFTRRAQLALVHPAATCRPSPAPGAAVELAPMDQAPPSGESDGQLRTSS